MANVTGYAIIQNAIPAELALQAADLIPGKLGVIVKRDEFTEFEIPRICLEIGKEFMKGYGKHRDLADLLESKTIPPPKSINVGIFHKIDTDLTRLKTALKGEVYVTIALTDLSPTNGLFIFLAKSHKRERVEWEENRLDLKAGDVVIWRGDLAYLHSSGGGGKFQTLVFGK